MSRRQVARYRFIPARAGNAPQGTDNNWGATVHPRACGERMESRLRPPSCSGSSPRVRGTLRHGRGVMGKPRFIPARAGNAQNSHAFNAARTVHPRACGERPAYIENRRICCGSSPRVRGTRPRIATTSVLPRFIPARAGNARLNHLRFPDSPVHPRACGERLARAMKDDGVTGSSPRVRGTRTLPSHPVGRDRFIPARAGNALLAHK